MWCKHFHDDPHYGLAVLFGAQGLCRHELMLEEHTVNREMYIEILFHLRHVVRRKHLEK
jgi:hypothetical protein